MQEFCNSFLLRRETLRTHADSLIVLKMMDHTRQMKCLRSQIIRRRRIIYLYYRIFLKRKEKKNVFQFPF